MSSTTYGAIKLATAEEVGAILKKKMGTVNGYKPKEWADTINLMGLLPVRTASGTIAHFSDGADDVPCVSVVANIEPIQSGSGTPSPSNPRPITGHTACNITQTGKNLFCDDYSKYRRLLDYYTMPIKFKQGSITLSVTLKEGKEDLSGWIVGFVKHGDKYADFGWGTYIEHSTNPKVKTLTIDDTYDNPRIVVFVSPYNEQTFNTFFDTYNVQLEYGTEATKYEPYTARTYTIDLGQEIMGGTADVVGGTGDARPYYESYNGETLVGPWICSQAVYPDTPPIGSQVLDLGGVATDFTFTGQEINSYLGVNNLYTDSGDTDVEYRADIDLLLANLEGNRGLQMTRSAPTGEEEEQTEEVEENENER